MGSIFCDDMGYGDHVSPSFSPSSYEVSLRGPLRLLIPLIEDP
jgi:hypothetical protein